MICGEIFSTITVTGLGVCHNGGRLTLYGGTGPSDHIEIRYGGNLGKEGKLMSDFELLSIVLMILAIIVTLVIALINTKK